MTEVRHTSFVIERDFRTTPERAFRYWSEHELKRRWTDCHPDWSMIEEVFDFRVGGIEAMRWRTAGGEEQTFTANYLDIAAPSRIIYAFEMSLGGRRVSASLATIELHTVRRQTAMKYTEQIAFLGSRATLAARIAGTGGGFDRLVEIVAKATGADA